MAATYGSIGGIFTILLASLVFLLLRPMQLHPLTIMPPKPKLNVHNFPRPPLLEKTPRHLQVKWREQTIADTKDAYWVLETTHPPSIPSESILRIVKRFLLLTTPSLLHPTRCLCPPSPPFIPHLFLRMERARYVLEPSIPQRRKGSHKQQSMEL